MGRLRAANTVDHVVPISEGGPPYPDHDGLASYCPSCHSAKTARGTEAGAAATSKPRRGCDQNGMPLDPSHPWAESLRADALDTAAPIFTELVRSFDNG